MNREIKFRFIKDGKEVFYDIKKLYETEEWTEEQHMYDVGDRIKVTNISGQSKIFEKKAVGNKRLKNKLDKNRMTKYKNKETGNFENLADIRREWEELLGNSNEFEEYRDNFDSFLDDYYLIIE
ncbi:MAG: hypothetical protein ACOC1P_00385 [Minisyncoccales bacterium]